MSILKTVEDLLVHEIKDLYSAETQLAMALPRMADAASHSAVRVEFEKHYKETKMHVERLASVARTLDVSPNGSPCRAIEGLIEEGAVAISADGEPAVIDLALIVAAHKFDYYEISAYRSVQILAEALGRDDVARLLQFTLDEKNATGETLAKLGRRLIPEAAAMTA